MVVVLVKAEALSNRTEKTVPISLAWFHKTVLRGKRLLVLRLSLWLLFYSLLT